MTDKTIKQRLKRMQALDKERGIVSARVRIPKADVALLRAFAAERRTLAKLG
jgi:hypothetical protein